MVASAPGLLPNLLSYCISQGRPWQWFPFLIDTGTKSTLHSTSNFTYAMYSIPL